MSCYFNECHSTQAAFYREDCVHVTELSADRAAVLSVAKTLYFKSVV